MKLITIHTSNEYQITCASQHVGTKTYLIWSRGVTRNWVEETIVNIRLGRLSMAHYASGMQTSILVHHLRLILSHYRKEKS